MVTHDWFLTLLSELWQDATVLIWEGTLNYPGMQEFAECIKQAIMTAHNAIIAARVQQTKQANKHRRNTPFKENDLVYLSTKNLKPRKGRAQKLVPKFLGPFRILEVIEPGATYKLELPEELKARGINDAFHASLLRQYIPSDNRRFLGRQVYQIPGFGEQPKKWTVDRIISHSGRGSEAEFEVQWLTGDVTWSYIIISNTSRYLMSTARHWVSPQSINCKLVGQKRGLTMLQRRQ